MLEYILPFLKDMDYRRIPPYQTFMRAQKVFVNNRYKRLFHSQGHESPGVKTLKYILQYIDEEYMERQTNNYDRYIHHVRHVKRSIDDIFDRTQRGRGYRNLFLHSGSMYTEEFLMPIEDTNAVVNLPLHSDRWEDWKNVRVLRLWDHDSEEYSIKFINDRLNFSTLPPSYCIELLDVVALIFKYYVWNKDQRQKEPEEELARFIPKQLFLHKYVICDLVWDETNIWILNCLDEMLTHTESDLGDLFMASNMRYDQQWGWIAMNSKEGFNALYKVIRDTRNNVRPESILSSNILTNGTLNERIQLCCNSLDLPGYRQYDYLRWLRDGKTLRIVLGLFNARPNLPITNRIKIYLKKDLKREITRRVWNTCQSIDLKDRIERDMNELYESL